MLDVLRKLLKIQRLGRGSKQTLCMSAHMERMHIGLIICHFLLSTFQVFIKILLMNYHVFFVPFLGLYTDFLEFKVSCWIAWTRGQRLRVIYFCPTAKQRGQKSSPNTYFNFINPLTGLIGLKKLFHLIKLSLVKECKLLELLELRRG